MSQRSNRWECRERDNRQIGGGYDHMKMNIVIPVKAGSCAKQCLAGP
jgi:hypothetical protein